MLSSAWAQLLILSGQGNVRLKECHWIYGQTQIAKYIPGNIFHYAGRHTLGRQAGFSHTALIGATLYEALCLLLAASTLSIIGIAAFGLDQIAISKWQLIIVFALSITILATTTISMPHVVKFAGGDLPAKGMGEKVTRLKNVLLLHAAFFLISGALFFIVVANHSQEISLSGFGLIIVISAAAWILGFITPGAPAGVGIREAIIVLTLTQLTDSSVAVIAAIIYRLITVLGDVVFFISARALTQRRPV